MEQDYISELYKNINGKRIGTEDQFREAMQDDSYARDLYENINGKRIGTFEQFLEAVRGTNSGAMPTDSQSDATEPTPYQIPGSQTPLDLLSNRPTPFITKKGESYSKLQDVLGKAEKEVEDEKDNLFEYVGKKVAGTVKNMANFGPLSPLNWTLAETERAVKEDYRVNAAEQKRKKVVESIDPQDVKPVSYQDLYEDLLNETGDEQTAVRQANMAIKDHSRRVNEIAQVQYNKLSAQDKKLADAVLSGQDVPNQDVSQEFLSWLDMQDKVKAQDQELNQHTDQYKEALTGILNVIGEAKNNNLTPEVTKAVIKGYVYSLPYDSPIRSKSQELYESSVKDELWVTDGFFDSVFTNTLTKGAKTIEAGLETAKWLGKGVAKMFEGIDSKLPYNDKNMSEEEKKVALQSSGRLITQALIDPSSKYTGGISEKVVDKDGRRLVVRDGQVIDIRRPDGTKVFFPTNKDKAIAQSYDPQKDVAREDYRGSSILYQTAQVISDIAPMILISSATGGSTAGVMLGSTSVSAGDYFQEGLNETGSIGKSVLYAWTTAPLIGYVEAKIGNIESKLGRAISKAERQGIFETVKNGVGKKIATEGIEGYVKGPGVMTRLSNAIRKAGEIGNDVKDELIEEISNFPVEFATKAISGMETGPAPKEELEATAILTPLVTMALGGAKVMFENQRDIDELVGYAAVNKDKFNQVAQQWIDSARTDTEKTQRTQEVAAKRAAVDEVADTFEYLNENEFTPKQKDSIMELSFEKARSLYRLSTSKSSKTKADMALKVKALDEKMNSIMNAEVKAADDYLNPEDDTPEPDLITTPKTETEIENPVVEPKIEEPAPVLDASFDEFLATEGKNLETDLALGDVEARMQNAEYIDVKELDQKSNKLYELWDKVDQDSRLSDETKEQLKSKLENLITKLDTYELATEDEVSTVTEGGAVKGVRIVGTKKIGNPSKFEVTPERIANQKATRVTDKNGKEFGGTFSLKSGKLSVQTKNGTIPVDLATLQFKQAVKEDDTVVGAEVYDPSTGNTYTIGNRELALDMAIKAKEMAFGVAEEPLFEQVFSEVTQTTTTNKKLVREGMPQAQKVTPSVTPSPDVVTVQASAIEKVEATPEIKTNENTKSPVPTSSAVPNTEGSVDTTTGNEEVDEETLLEPLGKTQKEREGQIEKFFTSQGEGVDKDTAKEQAKLTARIWQAVAKYFGKRNKQTADEYINGKVKLIGKTVTSNVGNLGLKSRFQIIGELGAKKLSDLEDKAFIIDNLSIAKSMEFDGKDVNTIRISTGWERGVDGFWRYEVRDNINTSSIDNAIDEWDLAMQEAEDEGGDVRDYFYGDDVFNLKEILGEKNELLTAYPVLVDYTIELNEDIPGKASVNTSKKIISINPIKTKNTKLEIVHEVQHIIQEEEGHSKGSSTADIFYEILPYIDINLVNNEGLKNLFNKFEVLKEYANSTVSEIIVEPILRQFLSEIGRKASLLDLKSAIKKENYDEFVKKYKLKDGEEFTIFDIYKKVAGEVEARNVSDRFYMTEEDRKSKSLKSTESFKRDEQIVLDDIYKIFESLNVEDQSPALMSQEMADQISANLLTQLDKMIEERTNPSKVAEMLTSNKGLTKADIKDQVSRLTEVKNQILGKGRVNYQGPRGALIEYAKNEMIMVALESPNVSTAIHELYHVFQGDLFPEEIQSVVDSYNEAFGTNHTLSDLKGKTAVDVEEWGARLWEKYFENGRKLTEKEVPNQKARTTLQNIFDKFTDWMKGVYNGVISYTNSQGATAEVNVSKPVQDMFDKILGITPIGEQTTQFSPGMEDLKFLKEMESFDFDNLNSACVRL